MGRLIRSVAVQSFAGVHLPLANVFVTSRPRAEVALFPLPGLNLQTLFDSTNSPLEYSLSSGVEKRQVKQGSRSRKVFVAKPPFKKPDEATVKLIQAGSQCPLDRSVTVLAIDPGICSSFRNNDEIHSSSISHEEKLAALERELAKLTESLPRYSGLESIYRRSWDLASTPSCSDSTAFDHQHGVYLGLHIDNHEKLLFSERKDGFQVLCINVGLEHRYLQYVNLDVVAILKLLDINVSEANKRFQSARALVELFFETYPSYPVARVRIPANHAYVAITQDLIHDGATNECGVLDMALLVGGKYRLVK